MIRPVKVGFPVSYDYELIKNSLPPVYEYAYRIVLAVDGANNRNLSSYRQNMRQSENEF